MLQNIIALITSLSRSILTKRSNFCFLSTPRTFCLIFLTVISSCCSISVSGFLMYLLSILTICSGIVAENSIVCLFFGTPLSIFSTSSMNPMSSILSASSRTTNLTFERSIVLRAMWSSILPGVATAICAPLSKASICGFMLTPPYKSTVFTFGANFLASLSVCCASSLVGARIIACNVFSGDRFSSIGSRKANVFPLPVLLLTAKSLPVRSIGIAFSCTSVGFSYFSFFRAVNSSGFIFNSLNFIVFFSEPFGSADER